MKKKNARSFLGITGKKIQEGLAALPVLEVNTRFRKAKVLSPDSEKNLVDVPDSDRIKTPRKESNDK